MMQFLTSAIAQSSFMKRALAAAVAFCFTVPFASSAAEIIAVGASITLVAAADGSPAPTFAWLKNGVAIAGVTDSILSIKNATLGDSGNYRVVATNEVGSAESPDFTLAVTAVVTPEKPSSGNTPPVIVAQPLGQTVNAGVSVTLSGAASGTPAPTYQWFRNGVAVGGWTNATLTLGSVTTNDSGSYVVVATNVAGTATSTAAVLTVNAVAGATGTGLRGDYYNGIAFDTLVGTRTDATVNFNWGGGSPFAGVGADNFTVRWSGEVEAPVTGSYVFSTTGDDGMRLKLNGATIIDDWNYHAPTDTFSAAVVLTAGKRVPITVEYLEAGGGALAQLWWQPPGGARVAIPSDRLYPTGGAQNIGPQITTQPLGQTVNAGVNATLAVISPLELANADAPSESMTPAFPFTSDARIVSFSVRNKTDFVRDALIIGFVINGHATLSLDGMKPTPGADDLPESAGDSASLKTFTTGGYTVQLGGNDAASAVASIQAYDVAETNPSKLVNLSVRTFVDAGPGAPCLGFVIGGTKPKRVLIRAVGPTLGTFGVSDVLADPQLELFRGVDRIGQNDDWGGAEALTSTFARVGAFALNGAGSRDAALLVKLEPGGYTVVVSGAGGSAGISLIEIFDVPGDRARRLPAPPDATR